MKRVKGAIRNLEPLIDKVTNINLIQALEDRQSLILTERNNLISQD